MLTKHEIKRYESQIILPDWGENGQEKLKASRVVVIGAGGLGSAVLTYLAVAGVGTIRIVDSDNVELSNLNRQVLYADRDIGKAKADSACKRLGAVNPHIQIEPVNAELNESNVFELIEDYLIVDALDNLETRLLLNRVSLSKQLPLFHGAVYGFEGRATTIIPKQTPCLQCLYQGSLPGQVAVVGATPGIIGCIQATEVIKYILGLEALLLGRLLVYDGLKMSFSQVNITKDPACEACR